MLNSMIKCPCNLEIYANCCEPYHTGKSLPQTPAALMRSRYSAYALANIEYIKQTMTGKPLKEFNEKEAKAWATSVTWQGLEVKEEKIINSNLGYVEFIAQFSTANKLQTLHEVSEFHRIEGRWFYVGGTYPKPKKKILQPISRNGPCPCGSEKKYKNCHGK
ncbi:putative SEC-C motif domain protein (plasmid) [Legionella adelaidensis]|uniref:Putative SEC-C motif domain protein n=2 Tax=Legionella adelaidensis TaxID=45056 RepID=A0A0W0R250_9GAMM|nr:putative SEC-C motif domain protein [Legionella adelaidensis]VEH85430.1 putative SEC-C motif domain protein [Legionella adelaidensis]